MSETHVVLLLIVPFVLLVSLVVMEIHDARVMDSRYVREWCDYYARLDAWERDGKAGLPPLGAPRYLNYHNRRVKREECMTHRRVRGL